MVRRPNRLSFNEIDGGRRMMETRNSGTKRSETTRILIQKKALEQGAQRSDDVRTRVRAVMKAIDEEIAENSGIYPHNQGALSVTEVARRADIHPTTLYSAKQRELGEEVRSWLNQLKGQEPIGRGPAKKELSTRIADWRRLFENLQQSHRDTELDLQETNAALEESVKTIEVLQAENERLLSLLSKSGTEKIVVLRPKKA